MEHLDLRSQRCGILITRMRLEQGIEDEWFLNRFGTSGVLGQHSRVLALMAHLKALRLGIGDRLDGGIALRHEPEQEVGVDPGVEPVGPMRAGELANLPDRPGGVGTLRIGSDAVAHPEHLVLHEEELSLAGLRTSERTLLVQGESGKGRKLAVAEELLRHRMVLAQVGSEVSSGPRLVTHGQGHPADVPRLGLELIPELDTVVVVVVNIERHGEFLPDVAAFGEIDIETSARFPVGRALGFREVSNPAVGGPLEILEHENLGRLVGRLPTLH